MLPFYVFISTISGQEIMLAICVAISIILFFKNYKKDFFKIFFTSTSAMAATFILKHLLKIPRPEHMLIIEDGYRFPSGHATMAAVVMSLGIYYTSLHIHNKSLRYTLYILAVLWYILVSYSRIYLQVHLPIDVIAGGIIGIVTTLTIIKIFKHFHYYK